MAVRLPSPWSNSLGTLRTTQASMQAAQPVQVSVLT